MSNTQLTQTGVQVQADLNRIEALPTPTSADSGKYLGVDSNGNFALISGSTPPTRVFTIDAYSNNSSLGSASVSSNKEVYIYG